jgi:desulfoferrodoxin (superoxide reductase-like protein)
MVTKKDEKDKHVPTIWYAEYKKLSNTNTTKDEKDKHVPTIWYAQY